MFQIPVPNTPNYTEPVIACYNGLWVQNGTDTPAYAVADGGYQGCNGKCSSIALSTYLMRMNMTATLYTCDPARVCNQLNLTNSCASPEPGVNGCCCDSDACIDPNFNRYPGSGLQCYVGVYNGANGVSIGAFSPCAGRCGSVQTYVNNQKMKAYFCLNKNQIEALGVDNGCRTIPADREVLACVCDSSNNCNVQGEPVMPNALNTSVSLLPYPFLTDNFSSLKILLPAGVVSTSTERTLEPPTGLDAKDSAPACNGRLPSKETTTPSPCTPATPPTSAKL